jgi:SNF2 family DNA or RNA helicase
VQAYGHGLAELRCIGPNGAPELDLNALAAADWVLTTYETLRDHDRDFGLVRFAVMLCDEAQKIKNPGVRITDAAKGMKADFRIAMTGTPVENRLSDLWCIVDGVHPGFLDDLKAFSSRYEATHDPETLKGLKRDLERPLGGRPPLLLRRMKYDHLPDLPPHEEVRHETLMPRAQADAYRGILEIARDADRRGAVLEALQRLRAVSLHPGATDDEGDGDFINASARLISSFKVLDDINQRGERVLIFVEDLALQPRLANIIQRRYRLLACPMLINGQVAGVARQARVDRFQRAPDGFDVMILSARAGGVGLTLTRANHVIHLSRWWNPAVEDQCTGRVLRIGQTRPVTIHLPLAVLPGGGISFDQNLQALLERKRKLMHAALIPTDETEGEHREVLEACLAG